MATRNLINWIDTRFRRLRSFPVLRPGLIPETFRGFESKRYRFVHIDLDVYKFIFDALDFARPVHGPEALGNNPRTILLGGIDFAPAIAADIESLYPGRGHRLVTISELF